MTQKCILLTLTKAVFNDKIALGVDRFISAESTENGLTIVKFESYPEDIEYTVNESPKEIQELINNLNK